MDSVPTIDSEGHDVKDELCLLVMRILQGNPDITQRELANRQGVSLGGINFCLKALADMGFLKFSRFKRSQKSWGMLMF